MRSCGTCSECCSVLTIKSFNKAAGTPCRHLDGGCNIYAIRPHNPCRTFTCGWLEGHFGENDRPDKAGVIIWGSKSDSGEIVVASLLEGREIPDHLMTALENMPAPVLVHEFGEEIDTAKARFIARSGAA